MSSRSESASDRPQQILQAAMVCFAKRGFHQASMHDISAEAGISVGLIYRYFENKDAVISAMADAHKREIQELLARAPGFVAAGSVRNVFYRALLFRRTSDRICFRGRSFRGRFAQSAHRQIGPRCPEHDDRWRGRADRSIAGNARHPCAQGSATNRRTNFRDFARDVDAGCGGRLASDGHAAP